jgi:hypothetical protein
LENGDITATPEIRRIYHLHRTEVECGWKVEFNYMRHWRANRVGSSTVLGRQRVEGETKGRKKAGL